MKKKQETVLVLCAHSDDQILGPGATLAKYAKEGKSIYTVIFTYGETALPWLKEKIAFKTRVKEARKADKVIGGGGVTFLGIQEKNFFTDIEKKEFIEKLKRLIKLKKPSKIFTHSPDDPHPMHRAVYKKLLQALDTLKNNCEVYSFDIWTPFTVKQSDAPKLYVDVSNTFNKKIDALRCFPSQWPSMWSLLWSVYVRARVHGFHIHARYAERFFKIR